MMYDTTKDDVVGTLTKPIKVSQNSELPKMTFFIVPTLKPPTATNPQIDLAVEAYVRLADLSESTRDQVRKELGLKS